MFSPVESRILDGQYCNVAVANQGANLGLPGGAHRSEKAPKWLPLIEFPIVVRYVLHGE